MSWVTVGVGAASIVGGVLGGKSAKKLQKQQLGLQRDSLNFAKQRYSDAETLYKPVQQKVVDGAMEGVKADLQGVSDRAAADVAQQYSGVTDALQRNQTRMGINPNSGQAMSAMRQTALSQALATAGGVTRARETERTNAEEQTWNRRFAVGQMGVNQMNGTASAVTSATNNIADSYGNMAASKAAAAGDLMAVGGQLLTKGLSAKFGSPAATPDAVPTNAGMNTTTSGVVPSQAKTFALPSINNAPLVATPLPGYQNANNPDPF